MASQRQQGQHISPVTHPPGFLPQASLPSACPEDLLFATTTPYTVTAGTSNPLKTGPTPLNRSPSTLHPDCRTESPDQPDLNLQVWGPGI